MKIRKITEEQALEMTCYSCGSDKELSQTLIDSWKKDGYIEKSKLDIAREYYDKIKDLEFNYDESLKDTLNKLKELYEDAVKEQSK